MTRRDFLQLGALPFLPRTAKSCIVLRLTGGPSHLDTWDMKPGAPSEIRGPFRPIRTNVPGIEISEIFPRMAKQADRFALIRSVYSEAPATHPPATSHHLPFLESCRRAPDQIEAGAKLITLDMFPTVFDERTWDIHGWRPFSPISCYRDHVGPLFDIAFTTLLEDLTRRGLLDTTLVVAAGEFGRTPKINPSGGRDHWPHCWTVLMAGGGVQGGQIYGSSDKTGAEPRDNPVPIGAIDAAISQTQT